MNNQPFSKKEVEAYSYKSMIFGWPRVDYYGSKESVFKKKTIGPRKRPMVIVVSVPRGCTRDEDRPLGLLCSPLR